MTARFLNSDGRLVSGEWHTCAACGKKLWVYLSVVTSAPGTFRGRAVPKGALVHRFHVFTDPEKAARLEDLRRRGQS